MSWERGSRIQGVLNSVKHVGAQIKSRIIGEVGSEGGRIWRDYCIIIKSQDDDFVGEGVG